MAPETVPPAERIRELSAINNDVAAMLGSAGQAIHALTNRPLHTTNEGEDTEMKDDPTDNSLEDHQKSFRQNVEAYFHTLQGVFARLRRQAYALEEAGVITTDSSVLGGVVPRSAPVGTAGNTSGPQGQPVQDVDRIKNGGLGNFDVGWLNSRGNKVGEEKEAELVQEAKELLEEVLAKGKK